MTVELQQATNTNPHIVEDQSRVERFLSSPDAFDATIKHIDRIDTYGAMLFLAGNEVIKIKRAVQYPYMDFSTLEKRKAVCLNEIKLNRRTAPSIYRDVCCVCEDSDGSLSLNYGEIPPPNCNVVEWGVVMARFDDSQRLDHLAERQQLDEGLLKHLANQIADFHIQAEVHTETPDFLEAMFRIVRENTEAFQEFPSVFEAPRVNAMAEIVDTQIHDLSGLLRARQKAGAVRHCHGDLHLGNIVCLDATPTLFDALEFDDKMAQIDVLYDIAFLLMDLWERGYKAAANTVFNRYLTVTSDYEGLACLPLFLSVRAAIRAKICAAQNEVTRARNYFTFAETFLTHCKPTLVAIGGLSGTGKSSLGKTIAPSFGLAPGAVHLRSDVIRKKLFGVDETTPLGEKAYNQETSASVYEAIRENARTALKAGHCVIADAVYALDLERQRIREIALECDVPFTGIWLEAAPTVLVNRVQSRKADASDADKDVVEKQLRYELGNLDWIKVSSENDLISVSKTVFKHLDQSTNRS